jgi:hypothetical protein
MFIVKSTYTAPWDLRIDFGRCTKGERHCRLESVVSRLRAELTSQATPILRAKRAAIGAANRHMFRMSAVGVMMAEIIKMTRIAYRRFRNLQRAVITRITAKKNTRIGISKISSSPTMIVPNTSYILQS